jgi:exo-beta-1,3-glucanase (GH17 family)
VRANLPSGACRAKSDWEKAFNTIKSFPGDFTSVRLYASSDCNTLANAVPAAIKTGITILGVWIEGNTHYEAEKQALPTAIQQHGSDGILTVSVGSEDLYRGDTRASTRASQLNDVRGMLWYVHLLLHMSWTAWIDSANSAVIEAPDFLGNDAYAFFEGASIDN